MNCGPLRCSKDGKERAWARIGSGSREDLERKEREKPGERGHGRAKTSTHERPTKEMEDLQELSLPAITGASRSEFARPYVTPVHAPNVRTDTAVTDAMIAFIVGLSSSITSSAPALVVMYASANMLM